MPASSRYAQGRMRPTALGVMPSNRALGGQPVSFRPIAPPSFQSPGGFRPPVGPPGQVPFDNGGVPVPPQMHPPMLPPGQVPFDNGGVPVPPQMPQGPYASRMSYLGG